MKITKFTHSCLLIEHDNITTLVDPGMYSKKALQPLLESEIPTPLDYLLFTHEHADHYDEESLERLVQLFPAMRVIATSSLKSTFSAKGIHASDHGDSIIQFTETPHEKLFDTEVPPHFTYTISKLLTHPGDSLQIHTSAPILALPITAPWGSVTQAVETALRLQPKVIIPIHDWQWKDDVRIQMYARLEKFFDQKGILFKQVVDQQSIEVEV